MSATRKPAPSAGSRCECGHRHSSHQFTGVFPLGRCGVVCECACTQYHRAESGAPLQPGATQPEHEGVAHETEPRCENENCGHPYWEHFHDAEGATCDVTGCHCLNYTGAEPEPTFTHSELTTLLERMARLVAEEAAKLLDATGIRLGESIPPDYIQMINCRQLAKGTRAYFTQEKLQQLREVVERP